MTQKENLPHFNKFFSSSFSSTSPAIGMPNPVDLWLDNLTIKFPSGFYNYTGLNRFVYEFVLLIYQFSTK